VRVAGLRELADLWIAPGRAHALVGAGGKSTGMRVLARMLSARGLRVRMSTTTRVGAAEFEAYPFVHAADAKSLAAALDSPAGEILIGSGIGGGKVLGLPPALFENTPIPEDCVLLLECDGSRRLPLKVPREHEPVVPANASAVLAVMGASAFGEPVSAQTCCNPEGVLALLGAAEGRFDTPALALLATHPLGCRKGVPAGAAFHLVVNQGDIAGRRPAALELMAELGRRAGGTSAVVLSWEAGELYGAVGEPLLERALPGALP
jgi:probable selenium-dependent hydroxylase accessory protein YqeC